MPCLHTHILFTLQGPKPCYLLIQQQVLALPSQKIAPPSQKRGNVSLSVSDLAHVILSSCPIADSSERDLMLSFACC